MVLVSSYVIYRRVFYTPVKHQNDLSLIPKGEQHEAYRERILSLTEALSKRECETLYIKSSDGLRLEGRYYHTSDNAPVLIFAHGYRSTAFRDFSGPSSFIFTLGLNVLLISERGCMGSEGHTITFGLRERGDVKRWVEYIKERLGENTPLYLMGNSMGAHTVLTLSSSLEGTNLRGIIADSPYTSSRAETESVMRRGGIPPFLLNWLVDISTMLWGGFRVTGKGAVEEVRKTKTPVLLIHGLDDRLVPCDMGREIASSNKKMVTLSLYEGAGHCLSYYVDSVRYKKEVSAFIEKTM